jgi:putative cardiolipin synthase
MHKQKRLIGLLTGALLAAGCASIDFDAPKSESRVITETGNTYLAHQVRDQVLMHPGKAGFYPIYDGVDSLALRLLMAERAERTIDAQYFLIHNDLVGNLFVQSLLAAANRGVRVRFLLDDVLSQGLDQGLVTMNAHENVEVRIFNPFAHRKFRAFDAPTSLGRITRRMHNKSFTVDNQVTLIGGRNIADEYFDARDDEKFADLDVLTIGPTVNDVSSLFDTYWNHAAAVPITQLAETPDNADTVLAGYHAKVSASLEEVETSKYADAIRRSFIDYVQTDTSPFVWADYDIVFDSPDKSQTATAAEAGSIVTQMKDHIGDVENELFVITAYFVLDKNEIETFRRARERGVNITILTNSLASNNHTIAHSGYTSARKKLLQMGVRLFELRASQNGSVDKNVSPGATLATLHAKTFVVDREKIFIGSFNWNQRSVNRDTELGVIIESPEIAMQLIDRVTPALSTIAFEVFLD